jgi:hypothetical protein|nr:MAG TPA: hypothetical protein [Caudoviricetes sp.]
MKAYSDFNGVVPEGVQVTVEGSLVRLFFDYAKNEITVEGEKREQLVCENVNATGRTYEELVSAIVTDRYSADRREAVFANYEEAKDEASELTEVKRAEYLKEYSDFQAWRKRAKEVANEALAKL